MEQHWTVERNHNYLASPRSKIQTSGIVIRYNPTPNPPCDEKGRPTSLSLTFPALAMTCWVADGEKIAGQIARQLNTHAQLLEALKFCVRRDPGLDSHKAVMAAIAAAEGVAEQKDAG